MENNDFWFSELLGSLLASLDQLRIANKLDSDPLLMICHRNPLVNLLNELFISKQAVIFDSADAYRFMGIILAKSEFLSKISSRSQSITQTLRGSQKNLIF